MRPLIEGRCNIYHRRVIAWFTQTATTKYSPLDSADLFKPDSIFLAQCPCCSRTHDFYASRGIQPSDVVNGSVVEGMLMASTKKPLASCDHKKMHRIVIISRHEQQQ
ncbi:hypothetical protein OXX79_011028 [Metschnikowia pulcherrima]